MKKYITLIIFFIISAGCKTKSDQCHGEFKKYNFLAGNVIVKFPSNWLKVDSTILYSDALEYNLDILSSDTSNYAFISIYNYNGTHIHPFGFNETKEIMKGKILSFSHSSKRLAKEDIKEDIRSINDCNVDFLKIIFWDTKFKKQACVGHIFFITSEKKYVEILLKSTDIDKLKAEERMNCIFNSLMIK